LLCLLCYYPLCEPVRLLIPHWQPDILPRFSSPDLLPRNRGTGFRRSHPWILSELHQRPHYHHINMIIISTKHHRKLGLTWRGMKIPSACDTSIRGNFQAHALCAHTAWSPETTTYQPGMRPGPRAATFVLSRSFHTRL
jgi:hypothetical protein